MNALSDPVDAIFARFGVLDPWEPLVATGLANRVYATKHVVLRIATDHPEAVPDARTESVAAPVAHAAGVLTPRLLAVDHSGTLIDRPFSLWERVSGQPVGLHELGPRHEADLWCQVGVELSKLHRNVRACPDPNGYLDTPARELGLDGLLRGFVDADRIDAEVSRTIVQMVRQLEPHVHGEQTPCFLHGDLHDMNIMCTRTASLTAIIDWGDAGWGDPVLDLADIPLERIPSVLDAYEPTMAMDQSVKARIVWDKLRRRMDALRKDPRSALRVKDLRAFLDGAG